MRTVAVVNASGRFDGISLGSLRFADVLERLGYGVTWYQCVDPGVEPVDRSGGQIVDGSHVPGIGMGIDRLWTFPRRLRGLTADITLLSDPTLINVARGRPNTVVRVHDLRPLTPFADRLGTRWMFRYAVPRLQRATRVLVTTNAVGQELVPWGIAMDRIRVVPETHTYGLHPDHISQSIDRITSSGIVRVACVSTDRPFKNLGLYIDLASAMRPTAMGRRFEFTLVSRLRPSTAAEIRRRALPNLRVLSGLGSLRDVYEGADLYVHPSLYEGFGRPLVEAMSFGIPVVAFRTPTTQEVVGDGGILLDSREVGPWETTLRALSDPESLSTRGRAAVSRAQAFQPDQFEKAVAAAFGDL